MLHSRSWVDVKYGQPVIMFSCTPHSSSPSENPNTNVKLYGQVIEPTIEYGLRCTMYKNVGGLMNMMVISPNKSCDGLPDMLSDPEAKIPVGKQSKYTVGMCNVEYQDKVYNLTLKLNAVEENSKES
ncbi:hypothetical protein ACI65C_006825 [Semiaphis heraclei]